MQFPDRYKHWCSHDLDGGYSKLYKGLQVEDRAKVWAFIEENYLERYRLILLLGFDWGAEGIWSPPFPGSVAMGGAWDLKNLGLPEEVAATVLEWHDFADERNAPWDPNCTFDYDSWGRWGLQVAKRVRLALPEDIYLEYHPFRQLVAGDRGSVLELEVPAFIQALCPGGSD